MRESTESRRAPVATLSVSMKANSGRFEYAEIIKSMERDDDAN